MLVATKTDVLGDLIRSAGGGDMTDCLCGPWTRVGLAMLTYHCQAGRGWYALRHQLEMSEMESKSYRLLNGP